MKPSEPNSANPSESAAPSPYSSKNAPVRHGLKRIEPASAGALEILMEWTSGETFTVPYFELRFQCPCASCVDELTGKRVLRREQIKPDVKPMAVVPVGRYAIQINWSDAHRTGIYPFDGLYRICEQFGFRRLISAQASRSRD